MALYDLTPTESRIALAAIGGDSKQNILAHNQISENTLKTHLSRIYKKTRSNNFADLVKLAATIGSPNKTLS
jgi:DNA-binding CsgD family transcriptional regulator